MVDDERGRLEVEKLAIEVAHLRRPWFCRVDSYVALVGAAVAVVGAWIAATTRTTEAELRVIELHRLQKEQEAQLSESQRDLKEARARVGEVEAKLSDNLERLEDAHLAKERLAEDARNYEHFIDSEVERLGAVGGHQCLDLRDSLALARDRAEVLTASAEVPLPSQVGPAAATAIGAAVNFVAPGLTAARAALARGDSADAKKHLMAAAEAARGASIAPDLAYRLGRALENVYEWNSAEDLFRSALAADPSYEPARFALASLLLLTGHFDEVLRYTSQESALAKRALDLRDQDEKCRAGQTAACTRIGVSFFYSEGAAERKNVAERYLKLAGPADPQARHYLKLLDEATEVP